MIMELLLELASTIALTLLLCHFIFKLVSSSPPAFDSDLGDGNIGIVRGCDFLVQSRIADSGFENGVAILEGEEDEEEEASASQDLEDDENRCTDERIVERGGFREEVREFVEECLGVSESLGRHGEKLVEQEISGENVVEEGEMAVSQALEEDDENLCTDEKIIECVEFAEEVREFVDESLGVSENLGRLGEKLVEQEISCENVEEEEEAAVNQAVEEDESRWTEEKITERAESGEKVREIVNESTDVTEDFERLGEKLAEKEISGENGDSFEQERNLFEESPETDNAGEIEECLGEEEDDDDWVSIERTEVEKLFGSAMAFVESASISILDNDVKTKLYGLRKIATQGPCSEPQPMALKVSARAKCEVMMETEFSWPNFFARNAWQQLGEMTRETAMERYVSLLSDGVPGWMQDEHKKA